MAPGIPTRRRSNSSGAASSNTRATQSQVQAQKSTPASTPKPTLTSSRPKRRGRGLPLAARSTSVSSADEGSNQVPVSSPPDTAVSSSQDRPIRLSRNSPRSAPTTSSSSAKTLPSISLLQAILPNTSGDTKSAQVQLSIKLSGKKFDPTLPVEELPLGHDGNTFYCQGCGGVGDVVCCDGCPHVYHRDCVPIGPSRQSLEQDDDPWYCPDCVVAQQKRCFECNELGINLKQCENCEGWIHFPSCHPDDDDDDEFEEDSDDDSPRKTKKLELDPNRILCRICRVEEMENASHDSESPAAVAVPSSSPPSTSRAKRTTTQTNKPSSTKEEKKTDYPYTKSQSQT